MATEQRHFASTTQARLLGEHLKMKDPTGNIIEWSLETYPGLDDKPRVLLKVTAVASLSLEEAEEILNS